MADATYIEPLSLHRLEQVILRARPDALLPNLGGQSGLNLCAELHKSGILDNYNVQVIGVNPDAIERGEDRTAFRATMQKLGIDIPRSDVAYTVSDAISIAESLGYPVVIRPAFTMGGTGGGLVCNRDELRTVCERGLSASIVHQVLVEESVSGWEELELEVVRDADNNMITVCFIENVDPMGVHTGDSFCTAPMLTINPELQARLQDMAYRIVEHIGVIGGTNVQFAHDPLTDRVVVIEINPRTSRSSALASKATGFPIAQVSAQLATGLRLSDIPCGKYGTLDRYTPGGDYVVTKFARFAFEKFRGIDDRLGTQMRAVGEVMSIGRTFKESFQKAVRSLEKGRYGLGFASRFHELSKSELLSMLEYPTSERYFVIYEALRKGAGIDELHALTHVKKYFLEQMLELVQEEEHIRTYRGGLPPDDVLIQAKINGFADRYLSGLLDIPESQLRERRESLSLYPSWESIHVAGTESGAYYYSTCSRTESESPEVPVSGIPKVMILGSGPNRIGQGIEFDYCCVHAAQSLRKLGFETIIVNCNPETVSTDYDTSDKLYFEPLTLEDVLNIHAREHPVGVIAQFGGQTPLNLASELERNGVRILGTSPEIIDLAEDRGRFKSVMDSLGIPMPESGMAANLEEAHAVANRIGYPVMVRPSYVLGGRGMEIVYDESSLDSYVKAAELVTPDRPILIDRFLNHALECEADAICDGTHAYVPAVMEHIELAGIHSGDSACIIPSRHISPEALATIKDYTRKIAEAMHVVGLMNIQYAIENGKVFVLEANPRASRTVPLVSKVCGIMMVPLAVECMTREFTGRPSPLESLTERVIPYYGVKESVFPFSMFPEVDPVLGPEMRSTGEVLGIATSPGTAFFRAEEAANASLPLTGNVLISVSDSDKAEIPDIARKFVSAGFRILATEGTFEALRASGIDCERVGPGRPDVTDHIINGHVQLVINTPREKAFTNTGSRLRRGAVRARIPYITTLAGASAAIEGIMTVKNAQGSESESESVRSLQEWHGMIRDTTRKEQ